MFNRILVALDSSEMSTLVIESLSQIQLQPSTEVILAHIIVHTGADPDIAVDRPQVETADEIPYHYLEKLQTYQAELPCKSELELVSGGDPAEEIVRLANIRQVDLIMIGSRGLTGIDRILQGSVSSQVVADAPCSVLVVKPAG